MIESNSSNIIDVNGVVWSDWSLCPSAATVCSFVRTGSTAYCMLAWVVFRHAQLLPRFLLMCSLILSVWVFAVCFGYLFGHCLPIAFEHCVDRRTESSSVWLVLLSSMPKHGAVTRKGN